jgi:hypothetical protein
VWQSELLLSGGVVFALLQLPPLINEWFDRTQPRLDGNWLLVAVFLFLYAKITVLAMIFTFVAHLVIRTLWVAIIGLDSVYPKGIRWEATRYGPISRRLAEKDAAPLRSLAGPVDNFASLVFATGSLVASMAVTVLALTLLLVGLAHGAHRLWPAFAVNEIVMFFFGLLVVPPVAAWSLDRTVGGRLVPGSRTERAVSALHLSQRVFGPVRVLRQMMSVLISNLGNKRGTLVVVGLFYLLIGVTFVDLLARLGRLNLDNYAYIARDDGVGVVPAVHYRSQRTGTLRYSAAPSIEAPVATGPWLALFLPFSPRAHAPALRRVDPALAPSPVEGSDKIGNAKAIAAEAERRRAVLAAIASLHPLTLNGQPLQGIVWDFHTDPNTEIAGMLAMIPLHALPPGRHELAVPRVDRRDEAAKATEDPPPPWTIPFWR